MKTTKIVTGTIGKWDVIIFLNDESVTIANLWKGGAIMTAPTFNEAREKFIKGMKLSEAAHKLLMRG